MQRKTIRIREDVKFRKLPAGEPSGAEIRPDFDDSSWETVRIPHDWAINGPFSVDNDKKVKRAVVDNESREVLQTGRTGGLPSPGVGVYRKWLRIDAREETEDERLFLEFDGVMWSSRVFVNGHECGGCHFGYRSFEVEITDFVEYGKNNLIAVRAEVGPYACRWYSGGGIYRNVRLTRKPSAFIRKDGIRIRQLSIGCDEAHLGVTVDTENSRGFSLRVCDPDGNVVLDEKFSSNEATVCISPVVRWDVDSPRLYTFTVALESGDSETVRYGLRSSRFTTDGYFLNGRRLKLNGVCMHHDLGSLGAAVNKTALKRQIEILQGMGVNAIRTSHNPPAPEFLDLCDEMGILVMDEFFDEWKLAKVDSGYSRFFDEMAETDTAAIIARDANHPCVIIWSIGNEIREQQFPDNPLGAEICRRLVDCCHRNDPTRPVTAGISRPITAFANKMVFYLDVVGLNYQPYIYRELREKYPEMILVGTETASCVSTRGVYHFPADPEIPVHRDADIAVSEYDLAAPRWAYYPERELAAQRDCPFVAGEFVWTGFDYLGEPTPYFEEWPSRSSYFGIVDLAGLPKNRYYCYRAAWLDEPTLHVFPHWTWHGREGQSVPVHAFTNYPEAELFLNGISQGKRRLRTEKDEADTVTGEIERFRLTWNDVIYTPGEICVKAYGENGEVKETVTVRTAGEAKRIKLELYKPTVAADGEDVNYITASIVDENGVLCPDRDQRLVFTVEGCGVLLTTDAGDQRETEAFNRPDKKTLGGRLVACVQGINGVPGGVRVVCTSAEQNGLEGSVEFESL